MGSKVWVTKGLIEDYYRRLQGRGISVTTSEKYRQILLAYRLDRGAEPGTPSDYVAWVHEGRKRGLSPSSLKLRIAAAKSYATWRGEGYDELDEYRLPPLADPVPHPLPGGMADARKMLAHPSAGPGTRALIGLQSLAGLRVAEAVAAEITDIVTRTDDGERYLALKVRGKGEKVREVPISSELAAILSTRGPGKLVGLTNSGARDAVTRIAERSGVTGSHGGRVSSHDLRATFATELYRATHDIILVQRTLGHADVKTTQRYVGSDTARARAAVNLL